MASNCFYLILHSILFIVTVFVVQVLSDPDGNYILENAGQPFDITFVPLKRVERQVVPVDKKPEEPVEDKGKLTKKPTALDAKTSASQTESASEKTRTGITKKEPMIKTINTTTLQSEPHVLNSSETLQKDIHVDGISHADILTPTLTTSSPDATTKVLNPAPTNVSVPDPDIQISKMFDVNFENFEKTLPEHNITSEKQDHHLYYNSSFVVDPELGQKYWVDLDKNSNAKISDVLSKAYRRAMTVKLSFDFPFYGHLIRNITIATGGFLYTGEYVHSWLAATQYIAPLMANFDTSLSNNSFVKYLDNGTAFTVQWENVILRENEKKGGFTFQCTLHKNGDIVFVYQQVAVVIGQIEDDNHPVKVGLSDAYIIDRTIFFVRRKTIYEYHRVNFHKEDIKNWTVIVLSALDTCLDMKDCHSCLTELNNFQICYAITFNKAQGQSLSLAGVNLRNGCFSYEQLQVACSRCNWCADRCSNGMDRHRQEWITNGCDKMKMKPVDECENFDLSKYEKLRSQGVQNTPKDEGVNIGIAGIMGILFIVCLGLGTGVWLFYAYRNPHTPAGQFLIRYRPSQWSWRRGEARYTAATIHM